MSFGGHYAQKKIVVTGAGKGIGRALVEELHRLGAEVYAVSRTQADLDSIVKGCPGVKPVQVDLSDWNETRRILTAALPGTIDVLFNNAGVLDVKTHLETTAEDIDKIFNVNIKALLNVTQICVSKMIAAGTAGTVVNVSSQAALRPFPSCPIYCASKAALDSLTKTMAVDFGKHGIRVVGFNPGLIQTAMGSNFIPTTPEEQEKAKKQMANRFPLGEYLIPMEEVVSCLLFLGSGIAGMMTGTSLVLDCGFLAT